MNAGPGFRLHPLTAGGAFSAFCTRLQAGKALGGPARALLRVHVRRPDCPNLVKAIEDALNGVVYLDDSQIVRLNVSKTYGETPGVAIRVVEL